jgi:hypothetical protein
MFLHLCKNLTSRDSTTRISVEEEENKLFRSKKDKSLSRCVHRALYSVIQKDYSKE